MSPEPKDYIEKASVDWKLITLMRSNDYVPYEGMCFHCQQYLEKVLKAKLLELGIDPPWTHDLVKLAEMLPRSKTAETIAKKATIFQTYGVDIRYPSLVPSHAPSEEEAIEAYDVAVEIFTMIHEKL
jgi:HEPN domain-containing protein